MTDQAPLSHLCAIPGCGKERRRKSRYCGIECLFWSHFDRSGGPDSCWLWTGPVNPQTGYGDVSDSTAGGKRTSAHRRAYKLTYGDPGPLSVLHRCDTKLCGNPRHLFPGTARDNWEDAIAKGRIMAVMPGERNAAAKLTAAEVQAIRRSSNRVAELVREFGVKHSTIMRIIRREGWRHVPDDPDMPADDGVVPSPKYRSPEESARIS